MKFWHSILLVGVALIPTTAPAVAKPEVPGSRLVCDLKDTRVNESSGLGASRKYSAQNLLWTHNDSGGKPELFLFNLQGETIAKVLLKGTTNVDWEDMAVAGEFIYVGDIGDNARRRDSLTIYRVREPQLDPQLRNQTLEVECEKMTVKFPDGAHDCETLMATPNGELIFVAKNFSKSGFYKTSAPFQNGATQTLESFGEYSFKGSSLYSFFTTGGDLSADESRFVVRTYTQLYEWDLSDDKNWKKALEAAPRIRDLPTTKQGEAVCYSADSARYFLSSEGIPTPIHELDQQK